MAFTSVAALAAATAETVTVTMVLGAVAEVGMALTVVGAVTGSKDLMKIGGAMSLIGGVGGFVAGAVSGATGAAAATEAAGGLSASASDAALNAIGDEAMSSLAGGTAADAAMADAAFAGADAATGALASPVASSGIVGSNLGQLSNAAPAEAATSTGMQVGPSVEPTVNDVATPQAPNAPAGAQGPATPYDTPNPTDQRLAAGTQTTPMSASPSTAPQNASSFFGKFSEFANKNKTLFAGGMQLVGGAMKGASDRSMWNEKMGLERDRMARANQVARFQPRGIVQGALQ